MSKEGSTQVTVRKPFKFKDPDFLNTEKLDKEMRRVFDICHGCRRCFNLCDSFPKLFDFIDDTNEGEVSALSSDKFNPVVDACTLCDMCFMTKCPYVPPHEFDLDFPHLMLRYRMSQRKKGEISNTVKQLVKIDRNAKVGIYFNKIINWISSVNNKFLRNILEFFTGIDKRAILPKYNSDTFANYFKYFKKKTFEKNINRKVVIYSTCFVNFNKKSTGVATLKVLQHNNVEVEHSYAGCCGMPYLEQADINQVVKQAKKVSKELHNYIDNGYKVITLTASCGLMLKFEWPLLLPEDEGIQALSKNTYDIDEYIVEIANNEGLQEGLKEIDGGVTVHHACHARAQNMGNKARDMLKLIPNVKIDLVERCAGHGGTFGLMKSTHDIANKVGKTTASAVKRKNNKYMASDCPLAGKHIEQLAKDTNIVSEEALHPIELIAKSYRL